MHASAAPGSYNQANSAVDCAKLRVKVLIACPWRRAWEVAWEVTGIEAVFARRACKPGRRGGGQGPAVHHPGHHSLPQPPRIKGSCPAAGAGLHHGHAVSGLSRLRGAPSLKNQEDCAALKRTSYRGFGHAEWLCQQGK